MKNWKQLLAVLLLVFTCGSTIAQPQPPSGKKWVKVETLSDEFNGNELDPQKWDNYHPNWSGRLPSKFKKGNAYVKDGNLCLESGMAKHPSTVNDPFKDYWVDAAACCSKTKAAKVGYYYEAYMKASNLSMTSSFWFRVGEYSEIDVIEHIGNPSKDHRDKDLPYQYHANTHVYGNKYPNMKGKSNPNEWKMPTRGRDEYHLYGFWWKDPNTLIFYHNDVEVMRIKPPVPFEENLKMIFDTEVFPFATAGVANIGLPLPENLKDPNKNTAYVDYVRVYKLEGVVNGEVSSIQLSDNNVTLANIGATKKISATVLPSNATNKTLKWTSSNTNIATVNNGTITAVGKGTATISATSTDGTNIKATVQVTVSGGIEEKSTVSFFDPPASVISGDDLKVTISYDAATELDLVAIINDPSGKWLTNSTQKVSAGKGTKTLTIKQDPAWDVGDDYKLGISIRPVGGGFDSNLDYKNVLFNVIPAIVEETEPVLLTKGWNLIGCPLEGNPALETALSSIWGKVELVKDFDAYYDSSNPSFNSLQNLQWGKGYFIKVSEACELIWE